jgi:hypothetical protein
VRPLDPYSVLGIAPGADEGAVRAALRARSRLLHPDVHRDAAGRAPQAAYDAYAQLVAAYRLALGDLPDSPAPATPRAAGPARRAVERRPPDPQPGGTARDAFLLAGVGFLGWLLVTDWLPAVLLYASR